MNVVTVGIYRDFFAAIAATAGALTGLLFVAMSVAPRRDPADGESVIHQVRAASALLAFVNALAISLFALVPGSAARVPAAAMGIVGILFTAAGARSILSSPTTPRQRLSQVGLINLLLLIFGAELVAGLILLVDPRRSAPQELIGYALVASLLVGIARAWELVGDRDTGVFASIAVLAHHSPRPRQAAGNPDAAAGDDATGPGPDPRQAGGPPADTGA